LLFHSDSSREWLRYFLLFHSDSSGEWVLTANDIECLCTGTGILGSGGGGSAYIGEMITKQIINEGKQIRITNPFRYKYV